MKRKYEAKSVNEELKTVLEDFKKTTASVVNTNSNNHKEESNLKSNINSQIVENDFEKHKAQNELVMTKQRIADLEDSKNNLTQQVQRLREQLEKFENTQFNPISVNDRMYLNQPTQHPVQHPSNTHQIPQQHLAPPLQQQQQQPSIPVQLNSDVTSLIDKYRKEIDQLNDNIQTLKMTLKDKELEEKEKNHETKSLKDKNSELDRENQILKNDLEIALQKLNELAYETSQAANQLNLFEEKLTISEKKRDELKQDAQETIKLYNLDLKIKFRSILKGF